eukprot:TRINITY_DN3375_c0_g1_i1.p1 TRINITY_DN3375_c0_g1~~TRINITY_DN3375_c0_g1_i1.p1  ORF type:complete len:350 (-),score=124.96 TRINITY_DN3375_c0_g1_i1:42-1064(-)
MALVALVLLCALVELTVAVSMWGGVTGGFVELLGSSLLPTTPAFQFDSCPGTGVACSNSTFCLVVSSSNGVGCAGGTVLVAGYNPQDNVVAVQPFLPNLGSCVDPYGVLSAPVFVDGEFQIMSNGDNSTSSCVFAIDATTLALRVVSQLKPQAGQLTMIYNPLTFVHKQLGAVGCTQNSFIDGAQYIECFSFANGKSIYRTPLAAVGGGDMSIYFCAFSDKLQRLVCAVPGAGNYPASCIQATGSSAQLRVIDIGTGGSRAILLSSQSPVALCPWQTSTIIGNTFSLMVQKNTPSNPSDPVNYITSIDIGSALSVRQLVARVTFQVPKATDINNLLPSPF